MSVFLESAVLVVVWQRFFCCFFLSSVLSNEYLAVSSIVTTFCQQRDGKRMLAKRTHLALLGE